jgi:hypothetical protein
MWHPPPLDHLTALSDDTGIVQHATRDVPNRSTGYCTDDVSRAFIVACLAAAHPAQRAEAVRLGRVYLSFLHDAQTPDGRFHNFMAFDRTWLDESGSEDSFGRALWALGVGVHTAPLESWRSICDDLIANALPVVETLTHIRARAYAALGLSMAYEAAPTARLSLARALRGLGDGLKADYEAARADDWEWFETGLTYDNARLPEAMLRIGMALNDGELIEIGLRTLGFYESLVVEDRIFVPIGNAGWYERGGRRARFGQQPLEAASLVDVALVALAVTGDQRYRRLAETGLEWFYGRNSRNVVMATGGGCYDGLEELGVNRNMGAESTLVSRRRISLGAPGRRGSTHRPIGRPSLANPLRDRDATRRSGLQFVRSL